MGAHDNNAVSSSLTLDAAAVAQDNTSAQPATEPLGNNAHLQKLGAPSLAPQHTSTSNNMDEDNNHDHQVDHHHPGTALGSDDIHHQPELKRPRLDDGPIHFNHTHCIINEQYNGHPQDNGSSSLEAYGDDAIVPAKDSLLAAKGTRSRKPPIPTTSNVPLTLNHHGKDGQPENDEDDYDEEDDEDYDPGRSVDDHDGPHPEEEDEEDDEDEEEGDEDDDDEEEDGDDDEEDGDDDEEDGDDEDLSVVHEPSGSGHPSRGDVSCHSGVYNNNEKESNDDNDDDAVDQDEKHDARTAY